MAGERRTWLLASAVLERPVSVDEAYPHVHSDRAVGRRGCAACVGTDEPESTGLRTGIGGHACRPAGRGTQGDAWSCEGCGAAWRLVVAERPGVQMWTWERA